jgi:tetratricopeptide (TPR) repeat protein
MTLTNLATCPYCLEEIRRQATRCKHCHADLSDLNPSGNNSTAGGPGSFNIGGSNHHIEGGIHVVNTLADLDGVDEETKRDLREKYESQVRTFPEKAQYHVALGLSYLDRGLYDLAFASLERALGKTSKDASVLYYLALARIAGRRPRTLKLAAVQEIERLLAAATLSDRAPAHYKLLLAIVKFDYYACNGLRIPPPSVDQLLRESMQGEVSSREIRSMLHHVPISDSPILAAIRAIH